VVKKAPLFAALDDEASATLLASMTQTRLERGDVLFHEGDQGDRLYVIREGKVKLGRRSSDGRENLVAILGPGEMFGERLVDRLARGPDELGQLFLGEVVGASRETVNKALADFATRGWLRLEARAVLLLDVERLKRRAR